jgi:hypothetical protein
MGSLTMDKVLKQPDKGPVSQLLDCGGKLLWRLADQLGRIFQLGMVRCGQSVVPTATLKRHNNLFVRRF